ncbi:hypothetical protein OG474_43140 [Kribbella sp. NBC_01505]|uniref:hypothetical protein n=1 Tax=Kribbella sp. NBC_01505 TaxID=2903580 RepID=UPI003869D1F5
MPTPNELAARAHLAGWLAQHSIDPASWTPEVLDTWQTSTVDEWIVIVPPGYANQIYLVADGTVFPFPPSHLSLDEAIAAARADRTHAAPEDLR